MSRLICLSCLVLIKLHLVILQMKLSDFSIVRKKQSRPSSTTYELWLNKLYRAEGILAKFDITHWKIQSLIQITPYQTLHQFCSIQSSSFQIFDSSSYFSFTYVSKEPHRNWSSEASLSIFWWEFQYPPSVWFSMSCFPFLISPILPSSNIEHSLIQYFLHSTQTRNWSGNLLLLLQ